MKRIKAAVGKLKEARKQRASWDKAWMAERFEELERQHGLILKKLEGDKVIPELEEQIRIAAKAVLNIDWKVEDMQVPPHKQQQKEKR